MRPLAVPAVALLLSACAGQPPVPELDWERHRAGIAALTDWQARGKVGLRTPERSDSASLDWTQRGGVSLLRLSGPIGLNNVVIRSDGQRLELQRDGDTRAWDQPDEVPLRELTGWELPLQALPYWLRGIPAPGDAVDRLETEGGLLRQLEQDRWQISYQSHAAFGGLLLPTRLELSRGDTRVRVILRQWLPLTP